MHASIIVCTYNRADSLRDTLLALQRLESPEAKEWEVVVVDNNSTDHTQDVIGEVSREWPRLRAVFESEQGLSHARNSGINAAQGGILLFTDDDVLPESDWLIATLEGLDRHDADACGGYIAPIWESPPPAWLTERFHGFLAVRADRDDDYAITQESQMPFGANMAIKRSVFDSVGFFDTARGRKGNVLASGEDGEMFARILKAGFCVVFLGRSRVHHKVEAFRLTKKYFRRWRFQTSRNLAISRGTTGSHRFLNIPLYMFPQLARAVLRMLWGYLALPKDEAFNRDMVVFHFLGFMRGLSMSRETPK